MFKVFDTKSVNAKPHSLDEQLILACSDSSPTYSLEKIKNLVDDGANVNARDRQGRTPLYHLVRITSHSITDAMLFLLEMGANIEARDVFGAKAYLVPSFTTPQCYNENMIALLKIADERKAMRHKIKYNSNESTNSIQQENAQKEPPALNL